MRFAKSPQAVRDDPHNFALRISWDGGSYLLEAFGELDAATAGLVDSSIQHGEETSAGSIVVDLSGVDFVASDVMEILADADARSRSNGGRLVLLRAPNHVHRVFEQSGLAARLPFIG